uniref:Putative secreted protein n=1 Tax=Anopheles darlingi TaxID=43151 RepID=A0A2M4DMP1_ANODA
MRSRWCSSRVGVLLLLLTVAVVAEAPATVPAVELVVVSAGPPGSVRPRGMLAAPSAATRSSRPSVGDTGRSWCCCCCCCCCSGELGVVASRGLLLLVRSSASSSCWVAAAANDP